MGVIIDQIESWDQSLFLWLNGAHNGLLDFLMPWFSDKYIWIPLYAFLLYLLWKHHRAQLLYVLIGLGLLIFISDQVASGLLKPWVERLRPCYEPALEGQVRVLKGCGGRYGFASSHASNSFAAAIFCWLMLRPYVKHIYWIIPWAAIVAYSRIYLGVHYPGDIFMGALIGWGAARFVYFLFNKITHAKTPKA